MKNRIAVFIGIYLTNNIACLQYTAFFHQYRRQVTIYRDIATMTDEHIRQSVMRASLRVNRLLTIFVRGENLLAERYEINAGYPMPRATVFGGLKLNL